MADLTKAFLEQLEAALRAYRELRARSKYDDMYDLDAHEHQRVIALCRAVVERVAGPNSPYAAQVSDLLRRNVFEGTRAGMLAGVVESLHADLSAGYLKTVAELLHGEIFGDFLEMADHLLENGYKDAAAVIIGSTLEAQLRQLCQKSVIPIEINTNSGLRRKKADQMNSDLAAVSAYGKLDQKNVTAWLDLRNKAAHGDYRAYSADQVALLSQGVRDFITRNPA